MAGLVNLNANCHPITHRVTRGLLVMQLLLMKTMERESNGSIILLTQGFRGIKKGRITALPVQPGNYGAFGNINS